MNATTCPTGMIAINWNRDAGLGPSDLSLHHVDLWFVRIACAMAICRLGRGACEYLEHLKLLVSHFPTREFTDEEWDEYVAIVARHSRTTPGFRVLAWNTQNATPRPEQQQRMTEVARGSAHKVALVTHEKACGFASSVLAFVNPNIGSFSEAERPAVWTHLELDATAQLQVEHALKRLQEQVDAR